MKVCKEFFREPSRFVDENLPSMSIEKKATELKLDGEPFRSLRASSKAQIEFSNNFFGEIIKKIKSLNRIKIKAFYTDNGGTQITHEMLSYFTLDYNTMYQLSLRPFFAKL